MYIKVLFVGLFSLTVLSVNGQTNNNAIQSNESNQLVASLNLTDRQYEQFDSLYTNYELSLITIRKDQSQARTEKKERIEKARNQFHKSLEKVFTKKQLAIYLDKRDPRGNLIIEPN